MPAFNVVAPDGRTFRLQAPDGATPEMIRAAGERAKAALAQMPGTQPAGAPPATGKAAPPAPATAPAQPTERIVEPPVYQPGGLGVGTPEEPGLAGTALYRGLVRPAALVSGLASRLGIPGAATPEEFQRAATGLGFPGAANLPTEAPEGVLGVASAALSPLEVFVPALWGVGTFAQYLTDNEAIGDAVEGAVGLYQLSRTGYRWWTRGGRETVQEGLNVVRRRAGLPEKPVTPKELRGRGPGERAFIEQEKKVRSAEAVAGRVEEAHLQAETLAARLYARQQEYAKAAMQAQNAAEIRATAALSRLNAVKGRLATQQDFRELPEQIVKTTIGLPPGAPGATAAGEVLTAAGAERTIAGFGTEVGVGAARNRAREATKAAYEVANDLANRKGIMLSMSSSAATDILDGMLKWAQRVEKYASAQERDAVKGILDEMSNADAIPYSRLNDLYARLSSLSMQPREFAVSAGPLAREELTRLKNTIQTGLRGLEVADPELLNAASKARQLTREGTKVRQTAKALIAQTPEAAFETMIRNPTHLRRVFEHAGAAEQDAYRMAYWTDIVEKATDLNGMTDVGKVLKSFESLPEQSRMLLASGVTHEARTAILKIAAGEKETAIGRSARRSAEKLVRDTARDLKEMQRLWTKAAERAGAQPHQFGDYLEAKRLAVESAKEAAVQMNNAKAMRVAVAEEQKLLDTLGSLTRSGRPPRNVTESLQLYHAMKTMQGLVSGNPLGFTSAAHGVFSYLLSRRAPLVRDLVRMPIDSPGWRAVAQTLPALTRGWRGFVEDNPDVVTPGQAAPMTALR